MTVLLKAVFGAFFGWIGGFFTAWLQRKEDRSQGAQDQAAKETAASMNTESKIAQAEANTGKSEKDIVNAASTGNF